MNFSVLTELNSGFIKYIYQKLPFQHLYILLTLMHFGVDALLCL